MTNLDTLDHTILTLRIKAWNARQGPRIGDRLSMPDGTVRRIACLAGDTMQPTSATALMDQRFYFGHGYCSFSGSLGELLPKEHLRDTGTMEQAPVWFFHHDQARAFNAVEAAIPCRVYCYDPPA